MKNTGKEYEKIVASIHRQLSGKAVVSENEKIKGRSGRMRQIDVVLRSTIIGYPVFIIVQCKDYSRKVDIEKVDSLIGTLEDVGASKGILVSDSGFSNGAVDRAKEDGRIELVSVVDVENQKLRANIMIPVLCEIVGVESRSWGIEETSILPTTYSSLDLQEASNKFNKLWNDDKLKEEPGEHEYKDILIDTPHVKKAFVYKYVVVKKYYYTEIGLEKGAGIYNVVDNTFRTNSISTDKILFSEIVSTWQEVDESYVSKAVIRFGLVAAMPEEV